MSDKSPWETHPVNVEEMLESCEALHLWELTNKRTAPYYWCICPTHELFADLCDRLIELEKAVYGD